MLIPAVVDAAPAAAPSPAGQHVFWVRSKSGVEVEPRGRPWLLTLPEGVFGLRPGAAYVVGRSSEADIRVDDSWARADTVSRKHARLILLEDGLRVDDLDSRNGTWVGSMRILPNKIHMLIHTGAPLQLGKLVLFVEPWRGLA
jgi:pSer/pThr/pTyr-binding forkhead associated (FHA) protein